MSVKRELQTARQLIRLGLDDEARDILHTIDHPTAEKWLNQLESAQHKEELDDAEDNTPQQATTNPLFIIVGSAFVIVLLVMGISALSIPNPPRRDVAQVAVVGDCDAQSWVDAVGGHMANVVNYNLFQMVTYDGSGILVLLPDAKNNLVASIQADIVTVQNTPVPGCIANAREHLLSSLNHLLDGTLNFDPNNPTPTFNSLARAVEQSQAVLQVLEPYDVRYVGLSRVAESQLTDSECPAYEWVFQQMYRETQLVLMVFFTQSIFNQPNGIATAQATLQHIDSQTARLRDTTPPACLEDARTHLLTMMDELAGVFEALLDNDQVRASRHNNALNDALLEFYITIQELGVNIQPFGYGIGS